MQTLRFTLLLIHYKYRLWIRENFHAQYDTVTQSWEYYGGNGFLADVIVSRRIVPDHFSILDVKTPTNTVDLRKQKRTSRFQLWKTPHTNNNNS